MISVEVESFETAKMRRGDLTPVPSDTNKATSLAHALRDKASSAPFGLKAVSQSIGSTRLWSCDQSRPASRPRRLQRAVNIPLGVLIRASHQSSVATKNCFEIPLRSQGATAIPHQP